MVSVRTAILAQPALLALAAATALSAQNFVPPQSAQADQPGVRHDLSAEDRADIYMARKMYREAIDTYSHAPESSATRWNKMGIAYHQLLDLRTAKKNYEVAIRLDPRYGEAINNLGTIYYGEKSYRRAVREYKKALRDLPSSASIYSNLGTAYFARKDYKKATETYEKALKLDPDVFEHHSTYGVLLQNNNVEERARFHFYLAKTYAKEGLTDRALLYIRKALEEGFGERKKFMVDPEFAGMRDNREFQDLMKSEPRVL
jgi:tetratricopeptide (TPR) repeat protein